MTTAAKKYWLIGALCISLPLALLMGGLFNWRTR